VQKKISKKDIIQRNPGKSNGDGDGEDGEY
jgi:hypothetical protein